MRNVAIAASTGKKGCHEEKQRSGKIELGFQIQYSEIIKQQGYSAP